MSDGLSNYDIYLNTLTAIAKQISLPIQPMTVAEFDQAEAALRAKLPYVHTSVIDMDAFEAALQPIRSETKEKP